MCMDRIPTIPAHCLMRIYVHRLTPTIYPRIDTCQCAGIYTYKIHAHQRVWMCGQKHFQNNRASTRLNVRAYRLEKMPAHRHVSMCGHRDSKNTRASTHLNVRTYYIYKTPRQLHPLNSTYITAHSHVIMCGPMWYNNIILSIHHTPFLYRRHFQLLSLSAVSRRLHQLPFAFVSRSCEVA